MEKFKSQTLYFLTGILVCIIVVASIAYAAIFPKDTLYIVSTTNPDQEKFLVYVEVAKTAKQQQQGLMYRQFMAGDAGMLFPFKNEQVADFWMHNTFLPLDILFIKSDGTITKIITDATPLSQDILSSGTPVKAVLELNGGTVEKRGINVGDKIVYSLFEDEPSN